MAGRTGRSLLLVAAVALATSLVVAVAVCIDTIEASVRVAAGQVIGSADLRLRHRASGRLDEKILDAIASRPGVALASGRFDTGISVRNERTGRHATLVAEGVDPAAHHRLHPMKLAAGVPLTSDGQCVIDQRLADHLGAIVGDELRVIRFGDPVTLRVMGVLDRPTLDVLQRAVVVVTLEQARVLAGYSGTGVLEQIDVSLRPGVDAEHARAEMEALLPATVLVQTPHAAGAGIHRALRGSRLMLSLVAGLVFLCAAFIILIGLTTAVTQRMRELAILRCVGAGRLQLASAQLIVGGLIALTGAVLGSPLGVVLANYVYQDKAQVLTSGLIVRPASLLWAMAVALASGLLGALYPALRAATTSPLTVLATRARQPRAAGLVACAAVGLLAVGVAPAVLAMSLDSQVTLWGFLYAGLPLTFLGYFLLSAPVLVLLTCLTWRILAPALAIPGQLLRQSLLATPYRHGFTGGALMVGLAMLLVIWTIGRSITQSYFADIRMPDAFVHSFHALTEQQWRGLQSVEAVSALCPTTMFPIDTRSHRFGLRGLSPDYTQFVATDVEAFVGMTDLVWVQGDPRKAVERMKAGDALLVSKEYLVAHGLGVGDTITLPTPLAGPVRFEVVGVVASPGLDIAVHFFGIQRAYADASLSCLFGTREDARRYFGVEAINLVLLALKPEVDDDEAMRQIKRNVPGVVTGLSRNILRMIRSWVGQFLAVASSVAAAALLIACAGVGNLVAAGIAAGRFEFGLLRAVGAHRLMLARLILAQTLLMALVGCVIGSALGAQLAWSAQYFHRRLVGLEYEPVIPWDMATLGWAVVLTAAVLSALPAIVGLIRTHPRELLAGADA